MTARYSICFQGVQSPVVLLTENKKRSIILSLQDFFEELCSPGIITVGGTTTGLEFGDA